MGTCWVIGMGEAVDQPVSRNNYNCRECEMQWDSVNIFVHLG